MSETKTDTDTQVIEALDWDPPCGSNYHGARGEGHAVWVVWTHICCPARGGLALSCDACLRWALHVPKGCTCPNCGHRYDLIRHYIKRIERIRP